MSHEFFELYQAYKRKTTKVFAWLKETCKLKKTSVTIFVDAAKTVIKQNIAVPPELYYTFKDAIRLREQVAQQFKQQISATKEDKSKIEAIEAHEHFLKRYVVEGARIS